MRIVRVDDPGAVGRSLAAGEPHEIIAVLPTSAVVLAGADELAAVLEYFDTDVVMASGDGFAAIGTVEALRQLAEGAPVAGVVDDGEEIFAYVADPARDLVHIGGRATSVRTGEPVVVALVDPAVDSTECPPGVDAELFEAVTGYRGAAAAGDDTVEIAPELLRMPMLSAEYCGQLVRLAEQAGYWGRDETDPVPGDEVSLFTLAPRLFAALEHDLEVRIVPRLRRYWPHFAWCGLHDAFVIRYGATPDGPLELPLHHDVAQISGSVRLNAGYEGGALEFPRQRFTTECAAVGELFAWPSLVTHPHRALPVTAGVKYNLTLWLRLPAADG